jgi:hypothetical protein
VKRIQIGLVRWPGNEVVGIDSFDRGAETHVHFSLALIEGLTPLFNLRSLLVGNLGLLE